MEQTSLVSEHVWWPDASARTPTFSDEATPVMLRGTSQSDRAHWWAVRHRWSPDSQWRPLFLRSVLVTYLERRLVATMCTDISSVPAEAEMVQVFVVPVDTSPAELVRAGEELPISRSPAPLSAAGRALSAVADIQSWLGMGRDDVAQVAGYSPRSIKNWREGTDPYPATVRRLFDIHALVGSLTQRLGQDGTRVWLATAAAGGRARRELLGTEDGLRNLVSEAAPILFEAPVRDARTVQFEEPTRPETPPRPELFVRAAHRTRHRD